MTVQDIKNRMPGYQAWNDPAAIMADYNATGGVGKGNAPSGATTVAPTYSGPPGTAEQGRVDELTRALAETTRNMPQTATDLRNTMIQNDPITPELSGQYSDAIMQLYAHDQQLGEQFSNPQGEAYIEDPMARDRAIQASRGPMVGNIGYLNQMIGTRREVLKSAAEKGLETLKYGLAAQELELKYAEAALERAQKTKSKEDDRIAAQNLEESRRRYEASLKGSTYNTKTGTATKESIAEPLTTKQTSDLRSDLADDIRGDKQNAISRDQSFRENRALYPELSDEEFRKLYDALWPPEPTPSPGTGSGWWNKFKEELLKTRVYE